MQAKLDRAGEDIYRIEVVIPVAIATFYAWLVERGGPGWLYAVPPIIALLGFCRYVARFFYIRRAEQYVRGLEDFLRSKKGPLGWEHFYKDKLWWYLFVRLAFWIILVGATSFVAWARFFNPELLK